LNTERLAAYKAKLIVFPRRKNVVKKGDSEAAEVAAAKQLKGKILPISSVSAVVEKPRAIKAEEKEFKAYATLRKKWSDARYAGVLKKKAAEKAEAEANAKK
jgi:large subunit ribosomal protein L13e